MVQTPSRNDGVIAAASQPSSAQNLQLQSTKMTTSRHQHPPMPRRSNSNSSKNSIIHNNGLHRFIRRLALSFGIAVITFSFIRALLTSSRLTLASHPQTQHASNIMMEESMATSRAIMEKYKKKKNPPPSSSNHTSNSAAVGKEEESLPSSSPLLSSSRLPNKSISFDYVVFYNIYLPPVDDDSTTENASSVVHAALDIVKEQLDQVGDSWAATNKNKNRINSTRLKVYYNTIGNPNAITDTFVEEHCTRRNKIDCIHMKHYNNAYEEVTLSKTQAYCEANPNHRVIYMHSKGTFHVFEGDMNHYWRRAMTAAVTSKLCLQSLLADDTTMSSSSTRTAGCNVCGLTFQPLWTTFFAGNFWTAQCRYINRLLPISQYQTRMQELAEHVHSNHSHNLETSIYLAKRMKDTDFMGTDRYAAEHWVGSHPDLRPCDVSPTSDLVYWWSAQNETTTTTTSTANNGIFNSSLFEWAMAPRVELKDNSWLGIRGKKHKKIRHFLERPLSARTKEYVMLGGHIHRWFYLYNATPPPSSWTWSFYPDAALWQGALQKFGVANNNSSSSSSIDDMMDKLADLAQNETLAWQQLVGDVFAMSHSDPAPAIEKTYTNPSRPFTTDNLDSEDGDASSQEPAMLGANTTISSTGSRPILQTTTSINEHTKHITTGATAEDAPTASNASTFSFPENNAHSSNNNSPNYSIFYNIYVPGDRQQKGIDNALRIVREQLAQVGASFAVQDALSKKQTVTLYYNTIGLENAITQDFMDYHCTERHEIRCVRMDHYESAFEQVTLQKTHEYCQAYPTHSVIYLHTKGSFHADHRQDYWRRSMTGAATSEACITKRQPANDANINATMDTSDTSECNACGLTFHPLWTMFYPGNIWTANCDYIVNLLPPAQYEKRMRSLAIDVIMNHDFTNTICDMNQMVKNDFWGVDRYSAEHWISSHPDIVPCDVAKNIKLYFWIGEQRPFSLFQLGLAPRKEIGGHAWAGLRNLTLIGEVLKSRDTRMREYVLLPGLLHRWFFLYNKAPAPSSWVWKWYPDGNYWLEEVMKYGANATRHTEKKL